MKMNSRLFGYQELVGLVVAMLVSGAALTLITALATGCKRLPNRPHRHRVPKQGRHPARRQRPFPKPRRRANLLLSRSAICP